MPPKKRPPLRGPSRPIDPRYAPGRPAQRGPDTFGLALIGISTAVVLLLVIFIARQAGQSTATTTTDPNTQSGSSQNSGSVATQQVQTQATQIAALPRISAADAKTQTGAKIVDVRTAQQYQAEHIKGAANIPTTEVAARMAEFPKEGNVILYCQWPQDEESVSVALTLRNAGYTNMKILQGGIDAWKAAGGETESQ